LSHPNILEVEAISPKGGLALKAGRASSPDYKCNNRLYKFISLSLFLAFYAASL
jgi:hypothetical protein